MDARLLEHIYTIDDIYELPEGTHAELIDGELFMMAAPSTKHQRIVSELHYLLKDFIKKNHGSCEVFPSPFAVFLNADDSIYLEPDLSVICDKKKLTDKGCYGAPDWIIEIVSPTSRQRDYNNYSNTIAQAFVNTGLQTIQKTALWFTILIKTKWRNIPSQTKSKPESLKTWKSIFPKSA